MSNIKIVKLITGDEIIGEIIKGQGVIIEKPASVFASVNAQGQQQVGISNALSLSTDKKLVIKNEHVLYMYTPTTKLAEAYIAHVSPLATATTPTLEL